MSSEEGNNTTNYAPQESGVLVGYNRRIQIGPSFAELDCCRVGTIVISCTSIHYKNWWCPNQFRLPHLGIYSICRPLRIENGRQLGNSALSYPPTGLGVFTDWSLQVSPTESATVPCCANFKLTRLEGDAQDTFFAAE